MITDVAFAKGHGTQNDFVVLPDPDGDLDLSPQRVAALCDRQRGLGADGVLRVLRTSASPEPAVAALAEQAAWFMDYRNADGSLAEMCGNGIRVFVRWLLEAGLVDGPVVTVATRAGALDVRVEGSGETLAVDLGRATPRGSGTTTVTIAGHELPATALEIPNPHAVAFVDSLAEAGDLRDAPTYDSELWPAGVNVEFVHVLAPGELEMRVHERGVGETRSCGTGAGAVVVAARRYVAGAKAGDPVGDEVPRTWRVHVPGGELRVTEAADGMVELAGPAVIVARGEIERAWWASLG